MVRRLAVGGALGIPTAIAGLAVGAASGDPTKAFQLAAAGGAAGYYGANYYGDKAAKSIGELGSGMRTSFWGEDLKAIDQAKFDKEFLNDPKNREALTKALGSRADVVKAIKDGTIQTFLNNNITDPSKIGKALKLQKKYMNGEGTPGGKKLSEDAALERAISMSIWNRDSGKGIYEPNSRARQVFRDQTIQQIINNSGVGQAEATKQVKQILKDLESFET